MFVYEALNNLFANSLLKILALPKSLLLESNAAINADCVLMGLNTFNLLITSPMSGWSAHFMRRL